MADLDLVQRARLDLAPVPTDLLRRASERSVRASVRNALTLAYEKGFRSIGFPLIGDGSGGLDPERAKAVMLDEILKSDGPIGVTFVVIKKR